MPIRFKLGDWITTSGVLEGQYRAPQPEPEPEPEPEEELEMNPDGNTAKPRTRYEYEWLVKAFIRFKPRDTGIYEQGAMERVVWAKTKNAALSVAINAEAASRQIIYGLEVQGNSITPLWSAEKTGNKKALPPPEPRVNKYITGSGLNSFSGTISSATSNPFGFIYPSRDRVIWRTEDATNLARIPEIPVPPIPPEPPEPQEGE